MRPPLGLFELNPRRIVGLLIVAVLVLVLVGIVGNWMVSAIMVVGCGLSVIILVATALNATPRDTRAEATERTLRVAANTLEHLRGGLTADNALAICALLLPETNASAIAITDRTQVLAHEGMVAPPYSTGARNTGPTLEVLESRRMETFVSVDQDNQDFRPFRIGQRIRGQRFGIIVPLLVQDRSVGTIKLYYSRDLDIDRTQLAIAEGLGQLLSTQLSSHELTRQAELTARAEVKALQAQINPHFLFNALNTIASFTRTAPTRARDLLREFSRFYRQTLESSEHTLIPLEQELEQTRRYLTIEKARFGDTRIAETEQVEPGCEQIKIPSFLVQPIVENAVRHAMRDSGILHIDVQVVADGNDMLIAVADDGLGMDLEATSRLQAKANGATAASESGKGAGMALRNVADRVERFFGEGSGIEILSRPGEGTCVTLRLSGALSQMQAQTSALSAGDKNDRRSCL